MTLAEIREVLLRELAARALSDGDLSGFARDVLLKRVGLPLILRNVHRGHRIQWQDRISGDALLVVERVEKDRVLFDSPRLSVAMTDFCKAVVNAQARDP